MYRSAALLQEKLSSWLSLGPQTMSFTIQKPRATWKQTHGSAAPWIPQAQGTLFLLLSPAKTMQDSSTAWTMETQLHSLSWTQTEQGT